jgi:hypothetical protein
MRVTQDYAPIRHTNGARKIITVYEKLDSVVVYD